MPKTCQVNSQKNLKKIVDNTEHRCYNKYRKREKLLKTRKVKKMTKRENYAILRTLVADNAELVAFIDHEIELLNKKNTKSDAPTKKQIENNALKADILANMGTEPMTISEMCDTIPCLNGQSNQKVSALVKQLLDDGRLVRTVVKRKAYFAKA